MILSSIAMVTVLGVGTFGASVKAYHEQKRKREMPWTVYAEKIERRRRTRLVGRAVTEARLRGAPFSNPFKAEHLKRLWPTFGGTNTRQQQLVEMSSSREEAESEASKKMGRYFALSATSLALTVGSIFYTPLLFASVPVLFISTLPLLKINFDFILKEQKIAVGLVDVLSVTGPVVTGHYLAGSIYLCFWYFSRHLTLKTEDHSRKSLINVFGEQPRFVWIQQKGSHPPVEVQVSFDEVEVGDIVVVHAGETISFDGIISEGEGTIDERTLTGESQPVEKGPDNKVFASTVLLSGRIGIQVQKAGRDTVAAQIGEMLNRTADFKSSTVSRGEKIVQLGAPPTLALGGLAWPLLGTQSALAVLFASFGYHMRVSGPISVLSFLRMASENGILIKDGRSLELLSEVDTVIFDKTGTLTEDVPTVGQIYSHAVGEHDVLTLAAAAEHKQTHPIALAIRREAKKRDLTLPPIDNTEVEIGYGVKVRLSEGSEDEERAIEGPLVRVGSRRFMQLSQIAIPADYDKIEEDCHAAGHSLVYVALDHQLAGAIELRPTIRPEAKQITSALQERGLEMAIISGDTIGPTKKLAESLGIERYFAQVLPQDKASLVAQLQEEGKSVCFIGDGINDSIALKKANVSISLRGASTAATDTAGIILMDGTLNKLVPLLELAKELDHNLTSNTVMSILPGIICIGGVFFFHFGLVSSIVVFNIGLAASVSNALLPLMKHNRKKDN